MSEMEKQKKTEICLRSAEDRLEISLIKQEASETDGIFEEQNVHAPSLSASFRSDAALRQTFYFDIPEINLVAVIGQQNVSIRQFAIVVVVFKFGFRLSF